MYFCSAWPVHLRYQTFLPLQGPIATSHIIAPSLFFSPPLHIHIKGGGAEYDNRPKGGWSIWLRRLADPSKAVSSNFEVRCAALHCQRNGSNNDSCVTAQ